MSTVPDRPAPEPSLSAGESWVDRWGRRLGGGWIFLLLLGMIVLFTALKPDQFATTFNLTTLTVDAAILLVLAVGQTFVIATAGIDLSVGSVLVCASVVSAKVMVLLSGAAGSTYGTTSGGWPVVLAGFASAIAVGVAFGLLNGVLIARARIPALIVTLGTLGIALGLAQIISGGQDVRAVPELLVNQIGAGAFLGIPILVCISVLVTVVAGLMLHFTRFGGWTFAIGSNQEASRRAGVSVRAQLVKVYVLAGTLAGLAGIMSTARFSTTTINGHTADNLTTISAVVLGGTSLFGGTGSIVGTVVGVFIPIILLNGFVILGIPPFWQTVAIGIVLILAVYIDQLKRRTRDRA